MPHPFFRLPYLAYVVVVTGRAFVPKDEYEECLTPYTQSLFWGKSENKESYWATYPSFVITSNHMVLRVIWEKSPRGYLTKF